MDIRIIQVVLDVFNRYGEAIRLNKNRFEEALEEVESNLVDERYLVVQAMNWGYYDMLIFDDEDHKDMYIDLLMNVNRLSEEESLFIISVFKQIVSKMQYHFMVDNMDEILDDTMERMDIFQLHIIASAYYRGFGVDQDYEKAFAIYQYLYDLSDLRSAYYLGQMYEHGLGVEQDLERAKRYYHASDDSLCLCALGMQEMNHDENQAINYLSKSDEALAKYHLAKIYEKKKEWALSFENYHKAAKRYHVASLRACGLALLEGRGVEQDIQEAMKYLRYGYYCLDHRCTYELGILYLNGEHIKQNIKKAIKYLTQAASLDSIDACLLLARLYDRGLYVEENHSLSMKYYKQVSIIERGNKHENI